MAYTYDLTTSIGQVRLTIGDKPITTVNGLMATFTDEELQTFLTAEAGNVGLASVDALRTWARQLAVKPKQQIGDYTFDPASMAKQLLTVADALALQLDDEADDPVIGEVGGDYWVRD